MKVETQNIPNNCCGGCPSDSPIIKEINSTTIDASSIKTNFKVLNMDCPDEIKAINDALRLKGILGVKANLMASTVEIIHTKDITKEVLKKRINSTVVKVVENEFSKNPNHARVFKVALSGVSLIAGLLLDYYLHNTFFANISYAVSILAGGTLIFPKAFSALKRFSLDMNVLMTFAIMGALIIKQYSEAATVVFLFALSELLESLSVQRARNAIQELFKLTPNSTFILEGNELKEVPVEIVKVDQTIRVKAGESIPLDGVVVKGQSSVNQAALTGESIPVYKSKGDEVFAGTINEDGSLDIQVTKLPGDTKLSQVIKLVAESQAERAPAQKFVDEFAKYYTPIVFILAFLTFVLPVAFGSNSYEWFYKALVLLVIACPCALVISTPISIVSALTALARRGVLVKGGAHLEMLGKIRAIALDKTGTITEGKPEVKNVITLPNHTEEQLLEVASALENHSTHPFAYAIIEYSKNFSIQIKEISNFKNIPGKGIEASLNGVTYFAANFKYLNELNLTTPEVNENLSMNGDSPTSIVFIGSKATSNSSGSVFGWINLGDTLRSNASQAIVNIRNAGIKDLVILSGDNQKITESIGKVVNIDRSFGDLLPENKLKKIEELIVEYKYVAMIGDGVNDAPAMAKSSLGIAMGGIGSGTAIETADVTLMADDLNQVAKAITLGKRTLKIIKFNIAFAILTKIIFLVLTFLGYSNLWIAIIADTGATLIVVLNSLRLLKLEE